MLTSSFRILFAIALLYTINIGSITAQDTLDISAQVKLNNLYKVDDGIYRSGQPNMKEFAALEALGIGEVLNMRRHHSDNAETRNTSLKLHHIKVRAEAINEKHLLKAMRIIRNREGDILVHCHHGSDRTGAVIAMYRIVFQGWTKEAAIDEMRNGGYGFHGIFRNIPKLIEKIDVEKFKKKLAEEEG